MNFQEAEKIYRGLKQQNVAGKLSDAEFEAKVGELWCQDAQGNWWQIGVESGEWYMHDGQKWNKATPPAPAAPSPSPLVTPAPKTPAAPPAAPSAPIEPAAPTTLPPAPAAPPPAPVVPAAPLPPADSSAAVESSAAQKDTRDSVPPARREGVAPTSSGKSLPTPVLIGGIAVAAVVAFVLVIGGCFFITGLLGSSATATPTRLLALLPPPVVSTPTLVPTDTPLPSPTIEITPTHTATRPAVRRPTPTPAGTTATPTLNVPPGVYVTNIETVPAKVNIGDTIGFKVSFLNTTGSVQTYNWFVKVYECPDQCQDFKHSHGETLLTNSNVAPGSSTLSTSQNINLRAGIRCDLIAIANYIDPVNQLPTPFQATKNDGHFSFTACH